MLLERPAPRGHNSGYFDGSTFARAVPPTETPPLLVSSPYVDMTPGCKPENLLDKYILSMQLYMAGSYNHELVQRYGWGKNPRHAR